MLHLHKYILFVFLVVYVSASCAEVEVATIDGIQYAITENYTATVIRQKDLSGEIVIADSVHVEGMSFPVKCVDKHAFSSCLGITLITLPPTVDIVYSSAFEGTAFYANKRNWRQDGCLFLNDILIRVSPKKVKKQFDVPKNTRVIASGAFSDCDKLIQITLPEGINCIPPEAFSKCTNLEHVNIPTTVRTIGDNAFNGTAIFRNPNNWENGILYIDQCAVSSNSKVPQILTFRQGTRIIADRLLRMNTRIVQVILPSSISHIGEQAFSNCRSLVEVDCGGNLEYIGNQAFLGCEQLSLVRNIHIVDKPQSFSNTELFMPIHKSAIIYIGAGTFYNCHSLSDIDIPDGLISINEYTFYNCFALRDVRLPETLFSIGEGAFAGCSNIEKIVIPSSVIQIGKGCFYRCTRLSKVDMSTCSQLTSIPSYFAKRCTNLREVLFPVNLDSIGKEAFTEDLKLESYVIPPNTQIDSDAFPVINAESEELKK